MDTFWIEVTSGERQGWLARAVRGLIAPAEALYRAAVARRNRRYDSGRSRIHRAACPVVSIGNITVGGTGKTPFVEWTIRELQALGLRPAVLSRGYGGRGSNEEALLLVDNCPGVAVVCNPDRVAGAAEAVRMHGADCVVLDDGFQHRRLHRDLDIVLIDATRPFGTGRLLPAGILREPLGELRRAHAVVLTRSDQVPADVLTRLRGELASRSPEAVIAEATHRPVAWQEHRGETHDPDWIGGRGAVAFSGVGNPAAFERAVAGLGANLLGTVRFGDHHRYTAADAARLAARAAELGAELAVTTQKDAVKLRDLWPQSALLAWLRIEMQVTSGGDALKTLLRERALEAKAQQTPRLG